MTYNPILIGAAPNDGLGDPLRTGGQKINAMFNEVYDWQANVNDVITHEYSAANPPDVANQFRMAAVGQNINGAQPFDNVYSIGVNIDPGGARIDPTKPAIYDAWESLYYLGGGGTGTPVMERHVKFVDTASNTLAPISLTVPYNGAADKATGSEIALSAESIRLNDYLGDPGVTYDFTQLKINYDAAFTAYYAANNVSIARQRNAADTDFLPLPYINADNRMQIGAPMNATTADPAIAGTVHYIGTNGALADGDTVLNNASAGTHSGSLTMIDSHATATFQLLRKLRNDRNTTNAMAIDEIEVGGASAGNAFTRYQNGTNTICVGQLNPNDDSFVISNDSWLADSNMGSSLAANALLRIDRTTKVHQVFGPLELTSYTVATVPAATTAARIIYVTDETGGAIPCFSDGTNWRRMSDRNIIS